jgi:Raf kinase inhibitor-like YbhB/YbcL family protein
MPFSLRSTAFSPNRSIPVVYTQDGLNVSPPLSWSGVPARTQSFALFVDDPDVPSGDFVHWVAWNIPGDDTGLPEDLAHLRDTRAKLQEGRNSYDRVGYVGPNPPPGRPHHYVFRLYALDGRLALDSRVTRAEVERAMHGHILDQALLVGTYGR